MQMRSVIMRGWRRWKRSWTTPKGSRGYLRTDGQLDPIFDYLVPVRHLFVYLMTPTSGTTAKVKLTDTRCLKRSVVFAGADVPGLPCSISLVKSRQETRCTLSMLARSDTAYGVRPDDFDAGRSRRCVSLDGLHRHIRTRCTGRSEVGDKCLHRARSMPLRLETTSMPHRLKTTSD